MTCTPLHASLPAGTRITHLCAVPLAVMVCAGLAAMVGSGPAWLIPAVAAAGMTFASARQLLNTTPPRHEPPRVLDEQLIQTQKFAALGQLSSGIAHEINTPLAIIGQEAEWMEHLLEQPAASGDTATGLRHSLDQISTQVERCRTITHSMLQFARKAGTVPQPTDLNALVEDMALLVEKDAQGRGIRLVRSYDSTLPHVPTDSPLMRQVILNILNNAVQAVDRDGSVFLSSARNGQCAAIEISDTGPGIPKDSMDRIFDPFFTTKPPGKGTGLGLSICQGIVTRLGGTLSAENRPGSGAAFTIRLPLTGPETPRANGHNLREA
ncbi:signal transduction histidine kinase [Desulfobaculum xiamenense]|uniref:histidine kinase n=1 Tax=Desulfobaculum xiamenense TaxID=995050 RepID=A0A846QSB2_9BACT|nr:ATP-binding protein [Desulfobaculum xiamenense]NJB68064.1 signal transduction histidine kinase [Desulfobaculum xiamenense]